MKIELKISLSIFLILVLNLMIVNAAITSSSPQLKSKSESDQTPLRENKMLRLCLWTQCKPRSMRKCPNYLERSVSRKCTLSNGKIGFYSKCCLYDTFKSSLSKNSPNSLWKKRFEVVIFRHGIFFLSSIMNLIPIILDFIFLKFLLLYIFDMNDLYTKII